MKSTLKFCFKYLFKEKNLFITIFALILLSTLFALITPFIYRYLIDDVLIAKHKEMIFIVVSVYFLSHLSKIVVDNVKNQYYLKLGTKIIFRLRKDVFGHVMHLPISFFNKNKQGDIISRLSGDLGIIESFTTETFIELFSQIITFIISVGILLYINPLICLISLPLLFLFPNIFKFAGKKIGKYTGIERTKNAEIMTVYNEALNNISLIKKYNTAQKETIKLCRLGREYGIAKIKSNLIMTFAALSAELIGTLPQNFIVLLIGGYQICEGNLTIGELLITNIYLSYLVRPINNLLRLSITLSKIKISVDRVKEYLNIENYDENYNNKSFPQENGLIEFSNVDYSYDITMPVLRNLSVSIKPNEKIAIVGSSGGGKTTFINLLLKYFTPNNGVITYNGVSLNEIDLKKYRSKIGVVWQDAYFFNDTIENNLKYSNQSLNITDLKRACSLSNIDNFIEALPEKYKTVIGDRGIRLSGGQKQRLSIARAILSNPDILVLDEASSHLDNESEKIISEALSSHFFDKTIIVIAHRLSTIINSDRIIYLHNGEIKEQGTHEELLAKKGLYHSLWNKQFSERKDNMNHD